MAVTGSWLYSSGTIAGPIAALPVVLSPIGACPGSCWPARCSPRSCSSSRRSCGSGCPGSGRPAARPSSVSPAFALLSSTSRRIHVLWSDLGKVLELLLAVDHNLFAGGDATRQNHLCTLGHIHRHRPRFNIVRRGWWSRIPLTRLPACLRTAACTTAAIRTASAASGSCTTTPPVESAFAGG